jgi:lysophospholipase L1-like esterase
MSSKTLLLMLFLVQIGTVGSFGQKRIVVLGSSTAAGNGAWPLDSSWVARLQTSFRKNPSDGMDTIIDNRAVAGYVTYKGLPSDYSLPANRTSWPPDPDRNITWILNQNPRPDIVLLCYPSNDANLPDYAEKETMDNLRLIFQQLSAAGIRCFVTGTQPRNDMSIDQRRMLREVRDSIVNTFGFYSIVFWDQLATSDGLNRMRDEVNSGDGVHPNNYGHRLLFEQVTSKNIFAVTGSAPLPLKLTNWQAAIENDVVKLTWSTSQEEPASFFEIQRGANSKDFQTVYAKNGNGANGNYSWTDQAPLSGTGFYRLKMTERSGASYSKTLVVNSRKEQHVISKVYLDGSNLQVRIQNVKNQQVICRIVNSSGAVVQQETRYLASSNDIITVPVSRLSSGAYFIEVKTSGGKNSIERFVKMK